MHKDKMFWVRVVSLILALLVTAACGTVPASVTPAEPDAPRHMRVNAAYGKLPLYFEANRGQTDEQVRFLARGSRSMLFLTPSEAVLAFTHRGVSRTVLRMTFSGANPEPSVVGAEELPGKANYFIGSNPANWRTDVPTYAKVRYKNVYPGIDLIYYGNQRQLEYDFVVSPGADPRRIRLGFSGADKLEVDAQGDLLLHTATGVIRQRKPVIYQEVEGARREIAGGYVLEGARRVGFRVTAYDAHRPLVIDPALFYSTYLGGSDSDEGFAIAVDTAGNAYVTGSTFSIDFPTTQGAFQTTLVGFHGVAFVTKLNSTGSGLVYSTYLGGAIEERGQAIAVDIAGNAYVTGRTFSKNFPTTPGAFQPTPDPLAGNSAFVTKLNPTGSALVYSTYLGGNNDDQGLGIAVDAAGNAYVAGQTRSSTFPTTPGAFQRFEGGGLNDPDAFVTKLNPLGSALVYSTYLGGGSPDHATGIALDAAGNAYVTGNTSSVEFPTTPGAYQTTFGGSNGVLTSSGDAFVVKLDPTGSALIYSTFLGGSGDDIAYGIALDSSGNAYVVGATASTDFPTTPGAFQTTFGGGETHVFVAKVNPLGSALVYSTYLGGSDHDEGFGIALDGLPSPNAYVTGETRSTDFPIIPGAIQPTFAGGTGFDVFVTKLDPTGSALIYSTYLGGPGDDYGNAIAVDALPNPNAYVTGVTGSTTFPTTPGAFQTSFGGGPPGSPYDAFVAQVTEATVPGGPFTARVTGGGTINVAGGIGNFHFIVQRQTDGTLSGRLQYVNHASGAQVQSVTYTSLVIAGNTATFDGTCTLNGAPCTFRVETMDNGEPGTTDTFTISYPFPAPTDGGTLRSGNILIR